MNEDRIEVQLYQRIWRNTLPETNQRVRIFLAELQVHSPALRMVDVMSMLLEEGLKHKEALAELVEQQRNGEAHAHSPVAK